MFRREGERREMKGLTSTGRKEEREEESEEFAVKEDDRRTNKKMGLQYDKKGMI